MPARPPSPDPESISPTPRRRRVAGGFTLRDVARLAGVAPITASRALNTPDAVSPAVLERVRAAVEQTGYIPNLLAGGLASRKSRLVAAVVPTIAGPVFMETVQALTESLNAAGYQLMLGQTGYDEAREEALLDAIIGRRPDAIFIAGLVRSARGRRRLHAAGIPVVETWDLTPTPVDMLVGFSHVGIGVEAARYLHQRGRRNVAVICGSDERAGRRSAAFLDEATRLAMGTRKPVVVAAPTTLASGREALGKLLARSSRIDAVFCSSDELALGVLIEARSRGLSVPDQLAVMGFGDLRYASSLDPPLTTVRIDGSRIGELAAQFIIRRMEGQDPGAKVMNVGFSIVERGTA